MRYSPERKESVLKKMMPPHSRTIKDLAAEEGISEASLYNWRQEARSKGILMPGGDAGPEGWNARDKFAAVLESASLNDHEAAEYCRRKGIYPYQLDQWRKACEEADDWDRQANIRLKSEQRTCRKQINGLEKELRRKEKAPAEAAALLILQKKVQAVRGDPEDE